METNRQKKIGSVLQKDLVDILQGEVRKNGIPNLVISVSKVSVTTDLSIATVYLSIFPPERHRDIVAKIYAALKLPCRIAEPVIASTRSCSTGYRVEEFSGQDYAVIRLTSYGPDAFRIVREHTAHLFGHGVQAVYLCLDLQNPETAQFAAEAESIGFLFAGVLPGGGPEGRDALFLQKVNLDAVDWLGNQLTSTLAREIFAYIWRDSELWSGGKT